jgi:Zn-dependent peptidase ImmA (M78 family)
MIELGGEIMIEAGKKIKNMRQLLGLTQQEIASAAGVRAEYISMVESGKRNPSMKVLSLLADYLGRDIGFFLSTREDPFVAVFRSGELGTEEKRILNKAVKLAEDYSFLEDITGKSLTQAPVFPGPSPVAMRDKRQMISYAEGLAEKERSRLGLGREPIRDIFSVLESEGLHVIGLEMGEVRLDGILLFSESKGAYVFINGTMDHFRQIFTAAHEYCHYLKDRENQYLIDRDISEASQTAKDIPIEMIANAFAASFLMPREAIEQAAGEFDRIGPEEIILLKRHFGVSYQAMVYRMLDLRRIKRNDLQAFLKIKPQKLERALYGVSGEDDKRQKPPLLPDRFKWLAAEAYSKGQITLNRFADLLGGDPLELREIMSEAGVAAV